MPHRKKIRTFVCYWPMDSPYIDHTNSNLRFSLLFKITTFRIMNYHRLRNRIVLTVAIMGGALGAVALDLPTRTVNGSVCYYYEVQPKETVYNLTRRFGLTKAQIIQYNPTVADGLRAGQTLYFPKDEVDRIAGQSMPSAPAPTTSAPRPSANSHLVKKGETIYGISRQYAISEDELIAANPSIEKNGLKYGSILIIPDKNQTSTEISTTEIAATQPVIRHTAPTADSGYTTPMMTDNQTVSVTDLGTVATGYVEAPAQTAPQVYIDDSSATTPAPTVEVEDNTLTTPFEALKPDALPDTLRLTIMLPFMLEASHPDKQAQLYTEFYRGLLMAADSLRSHGKPMVISAYDTAGSIDTVNSILEKEELAKSTVIIAPDDDMQLGRITSFASENGAKVFNTFAVKSTLYTTNPAMMQANIPHSDMYDTAVAGLLNEYPDYTPVLLLPTDGKTDKTEFQSRLRSKAADQGRQVIDVHYTSMLKNSDLESLTPGQKYLFVPSSGTQTEFARIISTLKDYKEHLDDYNGARLFGYPEWITFRGDALENMRFMNTTIYSRFFNDDTSLRSKDFSADYAAWYGTPMMNAIPVQGILGFDTGMYLIRTLNSADSFSSTSTYSGIQSDYRFTPDTKNAGLVNSALFLVNFRPSGITERISL